MSSLESVRYGQAEVTAAARTSEQAVAAAACTLDELAGEAPQRHAWMCRRGCAACCHLLVRVHPLEADRIATSVGAMPAPPVMQALAEDLDAGDYRRARIRCAFLDDDDGCVIYDVRPLKCRAHVSRDVEACNATTGPVPLDDWLGQVADALLLGLGEAPLEELHEAVLARRVPDTL